MKLESVKKILESKIKDELAFSVPEKNLYIISFKVHEIGRGASLSDIKKVLGKLVEQEIIEKYYVQKVNAGGYWAEQIVLNLSKIQTRKLNPRKYNFNSQTGELSNGEITIKLKVGTLQFKFVGLLLERRSEFFGYEEIKERLFPQAGSVKIVIKNIQDIAREINGKLEKEGEIDPPIQSSKGYRFQ